MATAQINARIDADVKALGDQALSSIGYSPTKAIRALWEFAGERIHDRKALRELFEMLQGEREAAKREADLAYWQAKVEEGPRMVERIFREMGVEDYTPPDFSDREALENLLYEAKVDKLGERGLWYDAE